MADGTLKVGTITTSSGSGTITIGQSGETVVFGSGVTTKFNQPAIAVQLSADQSVTDNTQTKIQFDNEILDTDNCYDNSTNYRFTPTVAGKYNIITTSTFETNTDSDLDQVFLTFRKNGSDIASIQQRFTGNQIRRTSACLSTTVDMNGSTDYIEVFGLINAIAPGALEFRGSVTNGSSIFQAYRLGVE